MPHHTNVGTADYLQWQFGSRQKPGNRLSVKCGGSLHTLSTYESIPQTTERHNGDMISIIRRA